jgi:chromosome segregation ATPase
LTAADNALTREIEALRDRLVQTGRDLEREREEQAANRRELEEIRENLGELAEAQTVLLDQLSQDI